MRFMHQPVWTNIVLVTIEGEVTSRTVKYSFIYWVILEVSK